MTGMTHKEKAQELINRFAPYDLLYNGNFENAKQCALIAVDEIIKSEPRYPSEVDWDDVGGAFEYYYEVQHEEALHYWEQVKQEINNL